MGRRSYYYWLIVFVWPTSLALTPVGIGRREALASLVVSSVWDDGDDVGIAIRRSVVRFAQLADALDKRWDALSFALRDKPPTGRSFEPRPLNAEVAARVRECGDRAAAGAAGVTASRVRELADDNAATYRGVVPEGFGYDTYCAFRAYNSLLATDAQAADFERRYGACVCNLPAFRTDESSVSLEAVAESLLGRLVDAGFADGLDFDPSGEEGLDRILLATLFRPVELKPRILLEAQSRRLGLRVLPDLATTLLRASLRRRNSDVDPKLEEYFLDPQYRTTNFDPADYTALQIAILVPPSQELPN